METFGIRGRRALLLAVASFIGVAPAMAAVDETEIIRQVQTLDWIAGPNVQEIAAIDATYELGTDEVMTIGEDARRYLELTQGASGWEDVDFLIIRETSAGTYLQTFYAHFDVGYIEDDDWSQLDHDDLLASIRETTDEQNRQRATNGYPTVEVDGWAQPPKYDRERNMVYWAIDASETGTGRIVNATALKLSRDGFTSVTWVGAPSDFHGAATLAGLGSAFRFDPGNRYADFSAGDAVAGVGLAALATRIASGKGWQKAAGAGLIAFVVAFAKKLWWLIVLPFLWLGRKLFRRDSTQDA